MEEATHIVVSRQMLSEFSKLLSKLKPDVAKDVAGTRACARIAHALALTCERVTESSVTEISKRLVSFEEPVSVIREFWASLLEADQDYEEAARVV